MKSIIFLLILSGNLLANTIVQYKPYLPVDCKIQDAERVSRLIPTLILENDELLTLTLVLGHGKCSDGKFVQDAYFEEEVYFTDIIADKFFNPFNYPVETNLKFSETPKGKLAIAVVDFKKKKIFKKRDSMIFDFSFGYEGPFMDQFLESKWMITLERVSKNKTDIRLISRN